MGTETHMMMETYYGIEKTEMYKTENINNHTEMNPATEMPVTEVPYS